MRPDETGGAATSYADPMMKAIPLNDRRPTPDDADPNGDILAWKPEKDRRHQYERGWHFLPAKWLTTVRAQMDLRADIAKYGGSAGYTHWAPVPTIEETA